MVGLSVNLENEIFYSIMLKKEAIKSLKWWQLFKRWRMKNELFVMQEAGAMIGFHQAMQDLEKIGLVKK